MAKEKSASVEKEDKPKYRTHIAQKGDTLHKIAGKYLGNTSRYKEIVEINKLPNDTIRIGQRLKLPES